MYPSWIQYAVFGPHDFLWSRLAHGHTLHLQVQFTFIILMYVEYAMGMHVMLSFEAAILLSPLHGSGHGTARVHAAWVAAAKYRLDSILAPLYDKINSHLTSRLRHVPVCHTRVPSGKGYVRRTTAIGAGRDRVPGTVQRGTTASAQGRFSQATAKANAHQLWCARPAG